MSLPLPEGERVNQDRILRYAREMDYAEFSPITVIRIRGVYILTTAQKKEETS